jgi:HK97 family phage portal protein
MKFPFFKSKKEKKANPITVLPYNEIQRRSISKVLLPHFMFHPPFGVPRNKDVFELRRLGKTLQAEMSKQTIIDEVASVEWDIKPNDEEDKEDEVIKSEIEEVKNFLINPNTNYESFEYLIRKMMGDLLDFDSGIWVKEFDDNKRMTEIVVADGSTFLKNPDIHGRYTYRDEIITDSIALTINPELSKYNNMTTGISIPEAKERAAYFQFGFTQVSRPIPFGKREVVWFEKNPRTDQIYGRSPLESIKDILQAMLFTQEDYLDVFLRNNLPRGFISGVGADEDEFKGFMERLRERMTMKSNYGGYERRNTYQIPAISGDAKFNKLEFTDDDLKFLEKQKWYSKLVWAQFGVTPTELGFTDDSNRSTDTNQSKVFNRKAVLPYLRLIEEIINNQIISEWDFSGKIKFEFNKFDVDEEKRKWELYKLQTKDSGLKTPNEIRKSEGLSEVEGGEKLVKEQTPFSQNFNNFGKQTGNNEQDDQEEQKSLTTQEPLAPKENEFINLVKQLLKEKEKALIIALRQQSRQERLNVIKMKSFEDIIRMLDNIINFNFLKGTIDKFTEMFFDKGIKKVENKFKDIPPTRANENQLRFLSEYTFSNIKGLEEDLKNKLKQQIRLSIMSGEGIGLMAERIRKTFDFSINRAETISRTETNRIENFGQLDAAKKSGEELKKWISIVKDDRTSEISKAMDRKYGSPEKAIPLEEDFEVVVGKKIIKGPAPPFHPNERDTLIFIQDDGFEGKSLKERLKESMKEK